MPEPIPETDIVYKSKPRCPEHRGEGECLVEDRGKDRHVWKWEEERSKPHLSIQSSFKNPGGNDESTS